MFEIWWSIRGVHQGMVAFDTAKDACNWIDEQDESIEGFRVDHIFQRSEDN